MSQRRHSQQWESTHQTKPEDNVTDSLVPLDSWEPAKSDHRQLRHLHEEKIRPDLLADYRHDELVTQSRKQKGEEGGR